ncbi:HlyC/CorC family transporter, partial [Candidatus Bipolaricaulota bacterium]|nr:HlyC/CorC family transporter [Candidatus Bipolaricaulota bacterium]
TVSIGAQIALLFFFIGCSAYFSSAETAITSLDEGRLRYLVNVHKKKRRGLSHLIDEPNDLITALLILNNLTNVAASSLMTLVAVQFLAQGLPTYQAGLIATGVMTVSLLIFGEITPKNFAKNNAERFTLATINQIYFFTRLLKPFIVIFRGIAYGIMRIFGEDLSKGEPLSVSDEQIETLIDASEESGLIDAEDGEMIRRILDFDEMTAEQVMVSRTDVQAIEVRTSPIKAREIVAADGHSRFPVYDRVPDNVVGTLYAKDLLAQVDTPNPTLHGLLRPVYYTPTTKPINVLLREFQKKQVHMAVVIDEYGGMAGIVTLEDIMEEIVGEIEDEYDRPIALIKRISSDEALVDGDTSVHELNRTMDLALPEDEGVTVSGLIIHRLEAMPKANDSVTVGPASLTVEGATETEITSVKVVVDRTVENEE